MPLELGKIRMSVTNGWQKWALANRSGQNGLDGQYGTTRLHGAMMASTSKITRETQEMDGTNQLFSAAHVVVKVSTTSLPGTK